MLRSKIAFTALLLLSTAVLAAPRPAEMTAATATLDATGKDAARTTLYCDYQRSSGLAMQAHMKNDQAGARTHGEKATAAKNALGNDFFKALAVATDALNAPDSAEKRAALAAARALDGKCRR